VDRTGCAGQEELGLVLQSELEHVLGALEAGLKDLDGRFVESVRACWASQVVYLVQVLKPGHGHSDVTAVSVSARMYMENKSMIDDGHDVFEVGVVLE
jgi:hypothetical protein